MFLSFNDSFTCPTYEVAVSQFLSRILIIILSVNSRTKIDWLIPEVQQADRVVTGAANLYLDGDKTQRLPKHRLPILGAKATYGSGKDFGKVLARKTAEPVRLSFLL